MKNTVCAFQRMKKKHPKSKAKRRFQGKAKRTRESEKKYKINSNKMK